MENKDASHSKGLIYAKTCHCHQCVILAELNIVLPAVEAKSLVMTAISPPPPPPTMKDVE